MTYPFHELDSGNERVRELRDLDLADAAALVWAVSHYECHPVLTIVTYVLEECFQLILRHARRQLGDKYGAIFAIPERGRMVLGNGEMRHDQGNAPLQPRLFL